MRALQTDREVRLTTASPQRRLTAIVAADVAGYTRLMGEDEPGTLAALKAHRAAVVDPLVAAHQGHIVKTTGDGLLLEFPSVVEAVACAVDMQRGIAERNRDVPSDRRIVFRIGVNIGDVIVDDGDVFGDGVNLAARLEQIAEPGGICLSEDVWRQVRGKTGAPIVDGGTQRLKNIAAPVRVYRVPPPERDVAAPRIAPGVGIGRRSVAVLAGFVLIVAGLIAAAVWYFAGIDPAHDRPAQTVTPAQPVARPSFPVVAVLPFADQTGDKDHAYLADGLTEELIDAIGRFNALRVIGRNAVLPYKGRAVPREEIVSRLGARYLVEGSVRRGDRRVRIAAQLSDAATGTVLWTDRFDGALTDVLDFQDRFARETAAKLATSITRVEGRRQIDHPKPNPDAFDLVLRGRAIGRNGSRRANREFRELMTSAIAMDPRYATAHALLAEGILAQVILGWTEFADRELARAEKLARQAIALAPDEPDGHRVLGRYLALHGEHRQARDELQRAIEINPSDTSALAVWGSAQCDDGDLDPGAKSLELALTYDPALEAVYVFDLAACRYLARRHEESLEIAERGLTRYPDFVMFDVIAAASAGQLGRTKQAERHVQEIRRRLPNFDFAVLGSRYRDPSFGDYMRAGLVRAGLDIPPAASPLRR